jgi:hypothetical protein
MRRHRSTRQTINHSYTATGESWIDSQHAHESSFARNIR